MKVCLRSSVRELNSTIVVLISKIKEPKKVSDFCFYKVESSTKVLKSGS